MKFQRDNSTIEIAVKEREREKKKKREANQSECKKKKIEKEEAEKKTETKRIRVLKTFLLINRERYLIVSGAFVEIPKRSTAGSCGDSFCGGIEQCALVKRKFKKPFDRNNRTTPRPVVFHFLERRNDHWLWNRHLKCCRVQPQWSTQILVSYYIFIFYFRITILRIDAKRNHKIRE